MARAKRRRKCRNCGDLFWPDSRNVNKQKYCSELDCRKASKNAAQVSEERDSEDAGQAKSGT